MVSKNLGEYIKEKGISYYAFENSINASRGSISKAVKENKSIGSNVIENILTIYKDLNPIWLFTGKGKMITEPYNEDNLKGSISNYSKLEIINYISENQEEFKTIKSFQLLLKSLYTDEKISEVQKEIDDLKVKVSNIVESRESD
ncbi:hypothetical protein [Aquimarina aggregata]|uniref:hypothetical protein n=1 Tax=Aquimarina aggregata TaxID=1642818 RepID=UPI0024911ADC|nr:hypothetical protein [Aquimarina aggregata]